jgi:putative polyhydroxyalkanoate system protein
MLALTATGVLGSGAGFDGPLGRSVNAGPRPFGSGDQCRGVTPGRGEISRKKAAYYGPSAGDLPDAKAPPSCFAFPGVCAICPMSLATIVFTRPHGLDPSDARRTAESIARRFEERLEVSWRWEGDSLHLIADRGKARGTSGRVHVRERVIDVMIHLPLHLRPMAAFLRSELVKRLELLLGPTPEY